MTPSDTAHPEGEMMAALIKLGNAARHPKEPMGWKVHNNYFLPWLSEQMGPEQIAYLRALIDYGSFLASTPPSRLQGEEGLQPVIPLNIDEARAVLSHIADRDKEVERLTTLWTDAENACAEAHERRLKVMARAEAAEAKLSALQEACKPFLAAAEQIHEAYQDDVWLWQRGERTSLTVGDLRNLGRALLHPTVPVENND